MSNQQTIPSHPNRIQRQQPADPVPDEKWDEHKQAIHDLYVVQRLKLQLVMERMEGKYGFKATQAQYLKQLRLWGFKKNNKRDHLAPATNNEPRDKRQCFRAEPQLVEDSDSSQEPAPAPGTNDHLEFSLAVPPASGSASNGHAESSALRHTADFALPLGNDNSGGQPQPLMADPQEFLNGVSFGDQLLNFGPDFNHNFDPTQLDGVELEHATDETSVNLSCAPVHADPVNIMDTRGVQSSQHAHTTTGSRASSSLVSSSLRQPIHQAAQAGNFASVKWLLEVTPQCANIRGGKEVTPLWIAAQGGYLHIVDLLLTHDVDLEVPLMDTGRTPIHQAAQEGHFDVVKRLLENNAKPDSQDESGITPLWSAAQQGHWKIVELLLEHGASRETASRDGERRPIHQAAQNGHVDVVRILLQYGAQPNPEQQSFNNETPSPFWLAAQNGNVLIGELLIKCNANKEFAIRSSRRRPIHQATQNGHVDFVRFLIQQNVDIDAKEEDGWTPLMMAAQEGHLEIVKSLLEASANPNAGEKDHATALWIASQQGHIDVVKMLHEKGARTIPVKGSKRRPIHQAAQNGHLEVVKFLVDSCEEDVNAEAAQEVTPLVLASQGEDDIRVEIMRFLHSRGAKTII